MVAESRVMNDAIEAEIVEAPPAPAQLAVREETPVRRVMSLEEIRNMGAVFFASGMFKDVRSEAQAIVKIVAGQELGIGPMSAMTQIQIVEGKPTLTAPAIGGRVKASERYDYRIIEHTSEACEIVFYDRREEVGRSRFTMDDARAASLAGKDVWRKYPRNMLFARAMTNGARWYCADVFNGAIYTAEELGDDLPPLAPPKPVDALPAPAKPPETASSDKQKRYAMVLCGKLNFTDDERHDFFESVAQYDRDGNPIRSWKAVVDAGKASLVIDALKAEVDKAVAAGVVAP